MKIVVVNVNTSQSTTDNIAEGRLRMAGLRERCAWPLSQALGLAEWQT